MSDTQPPARTVSRNRVDVAELVAAGMTLAAALRFAARLEWHRGTQA